MNEFQTYEFVVDRKKEGKYRASIIFGSIGIFSLLGIIAILFCVFNVPVLVTIVIGLIIPALGVRKHLLQEYEYSMTSGVMIFTVIRGGRSRKQKLELTIKDCKEIAPYDDNACARLENMGLKANYVMVSSMAAPDIYYALFTKDGENQIVYFEATQRALQILKFYNSATVVTKVSR